MRLEEIIIYACTTIFSLGLFAVSIYSYYKYKNKKLLFVSIVFLVFLIKGLILSYSLFNEQLINIEIGLYFGLFDLIILILLFAATLKR
jgi:hypothetical protein